MLILQKKSESHSKGTCIHKIYLINNSAEAFQKDSGTIFQNWAVHLS